MIYSMNEIVNGGSQMNPISRFFRSMRSSVITDSQFEQYYGALVRNQSNGGPSAAEARRDFAAVRESIERVSLY
jgi:hypothetical protein